MKNRIKSLSLALAGLAFLTLFLFTTSFCLAWELPEKVPGDFENKWYGVHCPKVPKKKMRGLVDGEEAFPKQTVINSWGYKAKPIEEIKELVPEVYYNICSNPDVWGDIRINETAYIPIEQWPGDHRKLIKEATEKNLGTARLDENGHITNYENGLPFPGSTTGIEIGWNFVYASNGGDEFLTRLYTAVVDKKGRTRYMVGEAAGLAWKGRLGGEHVPRLEPNPNNYEGFSSIGFKSPYDMKGLVGATHRYDSATRRMTSGCICPKSEESAGCQRPRGGTNAPEVWISHTMPLWVSRENPPTTIGSTLDGKSSCVVTMQKRNCRR